MSSQYDTGNQNSFTLISTSLWMLLIARRKHNWSDVNTDFIILYLWLNYVGDSGRFLNTPKSNWVPVHRTRKKNQTAGRCVDNSSPKHASISVHPYMYGHNGAAWHSGTVFFLGWASLWLYKCHLKTNTEIKSKIYLLHTWEDRYIDEQKQLNASVCILTLSKYLLT